MFLCCNGLILPRLTEIIKGVPGSFEYRPHKCTCTCASGRRCGAGDHGAEGRSGAGCPNSSSISELTIRPSVVKINDVDKNTQSDINIINPIIASSKGRADDNL